MHDSSTEELYYRLIGTGKGFKGFGSLGFSARFDYREALLQVDGN